MPVSVSLLAASAVRVASLNLCTDEYLLLLADPTQVASVSRLSQDPADSSLWRMARRYSSNRGSLEGALKDRPTLLLTMGGGGRASGLIARRMGLKTLDLSFPSTIDEVASNMASVASALGDPSRARHWHRRLKMLRAQPLRPVDSVFVAAGGDSIAAGSLGAQWMALAGFRQRPLPAARLSLETLAVRPPQILIRSSYRRSERSLAQTRLDHPLVRKAKSRTVWTDGRPWTCLGPLMVGEIERLRRER